MSSLAWPLDERREIPPGWEILGKRFLMVGSAVPPSPRPSLDWQIFARFVSFISYSRPCRFYSDMYSVMLYAASPSIAVGSILSWRVFRATAARAGRMRSCHSILYQPQPKTPFRFAACAIDSLLGPLEPSLHSPQAEGKHPDQTPTASPVSYWWRNPSPKCR